MRRARRPSRRPIGTAPIPLEKHEQAAGVGLLAWLGAKPYALGTARRKGDYQGTNQTPGISDVIAFLPRTKGVLFWEVKSQRGMPSVEQLELQALALACEAAGLGVFHCLGTFDALIAKLIAIGLLRPDQVAHYRLPASAVSVAVAAHSSKETTSCS